MIQREKSSNIAILLLLGGIMFYLSDQNASIWVLVLITIVMVLIAGKMVSTLF